MVIISEGVKLDVICEIMMLREDKIDDYINMHINPWPKLVKETKNFGIKEQYCFIYKNIVVVITKAKNVNKMYEELQKSAIHKKWSTIVRKMLVVNDNVNLSEIDVKRARCIFNLTEL